MAALIGAGVAVAASTALCCVSVVPAGHVGVVDVFGNVRSKTLQPGFHEGLTVNLDAAVLYRLDPSRAAAMYKEVGKNYSDTILKPHVRATLRDLTAKYEAKALYTSERTKMSTEMSEALQARLQQRGVIIENTPLKRITLPAALSEAIQSKLEMEQQSQRMHFVLERERKEAERREIEARGIAKFQEIVTQGITPGVLKWKAIEATEKLAESPNSKLVFIGNPRDGLPMMLSHDSELDKIAGRLNKEWSKQEGAKTGGKKGGWIF